MGSHGVWAGYDVLSWIPFQTLQLDESDSLPHGLKMMQLLRFMQVAPPRREAHPGV